MEQYKLFLKDLVTVFKEELEDAKQNKLVSKKDFDKGVKRVVYTKAA